MPYETVYMLIYVNVYVREYVINTEIYLYMVPCTFHAIYKSLKRILK